MGGAGKGGIQPPVKIFSQHFLRHIADIEEDVHPLSALRFVAGNGISIFYLHDIIVRIGFHLFHFACLGGNIVVIFQNGIEELVVEFFGKSG